MYVFKEAADGLEKHLDALLEEFVHRNQRHPAQIKNLYVSEQENSSLGFLQPNTSTDVVCSYEEGNPPVSARLLDRHGVEMEGSIYSSGQIRYRFPAVGCQDAGLIRFK
nr:hypothetical protein BaRGS_010083 [Batillaria attramentaria]